MENSSRSYPGFVFRRYNRTEDLELSSRAGSNQVNASKGYKGAYTSVQSIKLYREGNKLYYSFNGGEKIEAHSFDPINYFFDVTVTYGAIINSNGAPDRFLDGTLKNMYIKLQNKPEDFK